MNTGLLGLAADCAFILSFPAADRHPVNHTFCKHRLQWQWHQERHTSTAAWHTSQADKTVTGCSHIHHQDNMQHSQMRAAYSV